MRLLLGACQRRSARDLRRIASRCHIDLLSECLVGAVPLVVIGERIMGKLKQTAQPSTILRPTMSTKLFISFVLMLFWIIIGKSYTHVIILCVAMHFICFWNVSWSTMLVSHMPALASTLVMVTNCHACCERVSVVK